VSGPKLSVIVIVHDMEREAPRTLLSLSAAYQRDIAADDYEVIVVDNGSRVPFVPASVAGLGGNFRFVRLDPAPPSPARAINVGLAQARGEVIGVMIDGARMASPRVLHFALGGARLYPRSIVATLGWYLGSDFQSHAVTCGYNAQQEDALLESIGWPADGYRLFEISTPDESSVDAFLAGPSGPTPTPPLPRIFESNALFANRGTWDLLNGFDERFASPGGGLLSFDTFRRAMDLPDARLVLLLGEATFHQVHGGIATNAAPARFHERYPMWAAEYQAIRGRPFEFVKLSHTPTCLGTLHPHAMARLARTAIDPTRPWPLRPLGPAFDLWNWPDAQRDPPSDPTLAALVSLMRQEFKAGRYDAVTAIARMMRTRAPLEPEPLRLLRYLAPYFDERAARPRDRDARFYLGVGRAHRILGEEELAMAAFRDALARDPSLREAKDAVLAGNSFEEAPGGLRRNHA